MKDASRDAFNPEGGGGIKQRINANRVADGKEECGRFNHLVPISAGGCPGTEAGGNLQCKDEDECAEAYHAKLDGAET